jgi:hypothetical protein
MTDAELMQQIKTKWGAAITAALATSSLPPSFLGALIANESDGLPSATRYEPEVYTHLQSQHPDWADDRLRANATSWGLTQIMGINYGGPPEELLNPETNLKQAVQMLATFAEDYWLDLTVDFEYLFRCWNTGGPHGHTYDPEYAARGQARMVMW